MSSATESGSAHSATALPSRALRPQLLFDRFRGLAVEGRSAPHLSGPEPDSQRSRSGPQSLTEVPLGDLEQVYEDALGEELQIGSVLDPLSGVKIHAVDLSPMGNRPGEHAPRDIS